MSPPKRTRLVIKYFLMGKILGHPAIQCPETGRTLGLVGVETPDEILDGTDERHSRS